MERTYGKGMVGMTDPLTGKIDPTKFGMDNRLTGGARLGSSITVTIMDNLTIDGTSAMAFWLGWAKGMQYDGLESEDSTAPNQDIVVSDCFASTYALMTDIESFSYNRKRASKKGEFKGFSTWVKDPIHIFNNFVVNYEMCQLDSILTQAKQMAGMDYAAIADNATREFLVLTTEMPEAIGVIRSIKEAT